MGHRGGAGGGSPTCGSAVESSVLCAQPQNCHYFLWLLLLLSTITPRAVVSAARCPGSPADGARTQERDTHLSPGGAACGSAPLHRRAPPPRLYAAPGPASPSACGRGETKLSGDRWAGSRGRRNETECAARAPVRPACPGHSERARLPDRPRPPRGFREGRVLCPYPRPAESETARGAGPGHRDAGGSGARPSTAAPRASSHPSKAERCRQLGGA